MFPCLFSRLFPMFHHCETTSWRRKTTGESADHQGTSCSSWYRGLVSWCANFGIRETSRPTCLPMRCCRLWCFVARRTSKLPSKVRFVFPDEEQQIHSQQNMMLYIESCRLLCWLMVFCSAGDAVDFMTWFLNALHGALGGTKKKPCEWEQQIKILICNC